MGTNCSTPKLKITKPPKKSKNGVAPLSLQNLPDNVSSPSEHCKSAKTKSSTLDTLPNIGSVTFDFRSKSSTFDVGCEETPRVIHSNSPNDTNSNTSPTFDDIDMKKTFQYKKGPLIGKGGYGEVYECLNLSTGELLAAKSVKAYGDVTRLHNYIEALKKEIVVLNELSHPNVVRYYATEVSEDKNENCSIIDIISEYVSGGSIKSLLDKFDRLDERVVCAYTKQILEGLAYLHANEIVHRNLKSSNVLIDACGTAKLSDFGCFKNLDKFVNLNSQDNLKSPVSPKVTSLWAAPEVVMKKSQGKPSDIWSVGCLVLEMLTGLSPWTNLAANPEQAYKLISSGTPPPCPDHISENCKDFLYKIFKLRPEERPPAVELLEHPFIREQLPSLQSLSCLDYDSMQTYLFNQQGLRSMDSFQDDIFGNDKNTKPYANHLETPPKASEENQQESAKKKNFTGLSVCTDNNRIKPNHTNKHTVTNINQTLAKIGLKQVQEESSMEISKNKSDPENSEIENLTPAKLIKTFSFDPESQKVCNSPGLRIIREEKRSLTHTPIKNSFFCESNGTDETSLNKSKSVQNGYNKENNTTPHAKSIFRIQRVDSGQVLGDANKENVQINRNYGPPSKTPEEKRRRYEEQSRKELAEIGNRNELYVQNNQESESKKMELRRQFEEEMQRQMLQMSMTSINGNDI